MMKAGLRNVIVAAMFAALPGAAAAGDGADSVRTKVDVFAGAEVRAALTAPSFRDDVLSGMLDMSQARADRSARSAHLRVGIKGAKGSRLWRFWPGACQGLGVSLTDFGNRSGLGTPVGVYLFQGAPVMTRRRFSLGWEWNFGLAAGWRPCDGRVARSRLIVGSRVNAYINLGVTAAWRVAPAWQLVAGIDATHYSNGNTSFPNPGVNMAGLRVGVVYTPQAEAKVQEPQAPAEAFTRRLTYDITAYGAWRRRVYRGGEEPVLLEGRFAVAGVSFAPMVELALMFRAGLSADIQLDRSSGLKRYWLGGTTTDDIRFGHPSPLRQTSLGLAARAELVMPFFSVNVGVGYNVAGPVEARASYQMANLKIYVTPVLYVNIGYQLLNFKRQNNLMLGLGATIGGRRAPSLTSVM